MKKYASGILILATLCMLFTITAFAEKKEFSCTINKGNTYYTDVNKKSDSEKYAYVTVTDSDLITGDQVRYVISNKTCDGEVSQAITYSGAYNLYKQTLKYDATSGNKDVLYRLKIKTFNYNIKLTGKWDS